MWLGLLRLRETGTTQALVAQFEELLAMHKADRDWILRELQRQE
jgi:hypothetical protein